MEGPSHLSEKTVLLIRSWKAGDQEAGNELCRRYLPRVRRIVRVRARAWGIQFQEVEDVVQDAFLAATQAIERFQELGEGGLINWLATIASNKLRDRRTRARAAKRDAAREVPADALTPPGTPSSAAWEPEADSTRVPSRVARNEEKAFTDACLALLREDYREAIILRTLAACAWTTVAERLDCTVDAARKLYSTGRTKLAAEMRRQRPGFQPD